MHVTKFARGATGHMFAHYDRSKECPENIDSSRSCLNWNAAEADQPLGQIEFMQKRLQELKGDRAIRKDAKVMCDWILTAPKDLPPEEYKQFFESAYNFLADKYGRKNVISAYVHMDERSPHIHFAWVPAVFDQKKQTEKICAKECITRGDLKNMHKEMQSHLEKELQHPVNIITGELANRPDLTLPQFKAMKETEERLSLLQNHLETVKNAVAAIEQQLQIVNAEYEPKKAYVAEFAKSQEAISDGVKERKSLTGKKTVEMPAEKWESHSMSYMDKKAVLAMTEKAEQLIQKIQSDIKANGQDELLHQLQELQQYTRQLEQNNQFMSSEIDRVNTVFRTNPKALDIFRATERALTASQEQERDDDGELCR